MSWCKTFSRKDEQTWAKLSRTAGTSLTLFSFSIFPSRRGRHYKEAFISGIYSIHNWARIFKRLWSPGIDSKASIPLAYVAWRAGTITLFLLGAYSPHRFFISSSSEPVFVNLLRSSGIDSQPGGPVRLYYLSYRSARLHRLTDKFTNMGSDSQQKRCWELKAYKGRLKIYRTVDFCFYTMFL